MGHLDVTVTDRLHLNIQVMLISVYSFQDGFETFDFLSGGEAGQKVKLGMKVPILWPEGMTCRVNLKLIMIIFT